MRLRGLHRSDEEIECVRHGPRLHRLASWISIVVLPLLRRHAPSRERDADAADGIAPQAAGRGEPVRQDRSSVYPPPERQCVPEAKESNAVELEFEEALRAEDQQAAFIERDFRLTFKLHDLGRG